MPSARCGGSHGQSPRHRGGGRGGAVRPPSPRAATSTCAAEPIRTGRRPSPAAPTCAPRPCSAVQRGRTVGDERAAGLLRAAVLEDRPGGIAGEDVPPERERLRPATTLRRGACTIVVGEHDVYVYRGGDRLRVPPEARLYAHGERLTLVWFGPYGRRKSGGTVVLDSLSFPALLAVFIVAAGASGSQVSSSRTRRRAGHAAAPGERRSAG